MNDLRAKAGMPPSVREDEYPFGDLRVKPPIRSAFSIEEAPTCVRGSSHTRDEIQTPH